MSKYLLLAPSIAAVFVGLQHYIFYSTPSKKNKLKNVFDQIKMHKELSL